MDGPVDAPPQESETILLVCARLQQKLRHLNEESCNVKAGTYRAHLCEKELRLAGLSVKPGNIAYDLLLVEIMITRRKLAKWIARQAISRINLTIESMELTWVNCIEASCPYYHAMEAEYAVHVQARMGTTIWSSSKIQHLRNWILSAGNTQMPIYILYQPSSKQNQTHYIL